MRPNWMAWEFGSFRPVDCGGHSFLVDPDNERPLVDIRRSAEKAYYATGKWQVVHHHPDSARCADACEVFGLESEVPTRGS